METASLSCIWQPVAAYLDGGSQSHSDQVQIRSNQPSASPPMLRRRQLFPVTIILVGLNLGNFITMVVVSRIWPQVGLLQWGADWGPVSLHHQWWRLLTSTFIHFNAVHLLDNLVVLWILGKRVELILGKWAFLMVYLSCALAGSITSLALRPEDLVCGASGGVFGLAGGLISIHVVKGLNFPKNQLWKPILLVVWLAGNFYEGMMNPSKIDNGAHIAGLVTGLVLGAVLMMGKAPSERRLRWAFTSGFTILRFDA